MILAWLLKKKRDDQTMWSKGLHGPDTWSNAVGVGRCCLTDALINLDYETLEEDLNEE